MIARAVETSAACPRSSPPGRFFPATTASVAYTPLFGSSSCSVARFSVGTTSFRPCPVPGANFALERKRPSEHPRGRLPRALRAPRFESPCSKRPRHPRSPAARFRLRIPSAPPSRQAACTSPACRCPKRKFPPTSTASRAHRSTRNLLHKIFRADVSQVPRRIAAPAPHRSRSASNAASRCSSVISRAGASAGPQHSRRMRDKMSAPPTIRPARRARSTHAGAEFPDARGARRRNSRSSQRPAVPACSRIAPTHSFRRMQDSRAASEFHLELQPVVRQPHILGQARIRFRVAQVVADVREPRALRLQFLDQRQRLLDVRMRRVRHVAQRVQNEIVEPAEQRFRAFRHRLKSVR